MRLTEQDSDINATPAFWATILRVAEMLLVSHTATGSNPQASKNWSPIMRREAPFLDNKRLSPAKFAFTSSAVIGVPDGCVSAYG